MAELRIEDEKINYTIHVYQWDSYLMSSNRVIEYCDLVRGTSALVGSWRVVGLGHVVTCEHGS